MTIDIPDAVALVILTDLRASGLGGCKIIADAIQQKLDEQAEMAGLLERRNKQELEEAVNRFTSGFNRFRLLAALQEVEKS